MFAATSAAAAWGAAAPSDVIVRDGVEVSIQRAIAPATTADSISAVSLDLEARTDDAAHRFGFRSLHAVTLVDCRGRANQITEAKTFDEPNLAGPGHSQHVSGNWQQPTADSYMSTVIDRVCAASAAPAPPAPTIQVTLLGAAPAPAPTPAAPPQSGRAALPAPVVPLAVAPASFSSMSPNSRIEAQLAATDSARAAQRVLDSVRTLIALPLAGTVQPALAQGSQIFRASVGGFASTASAQAFCAQATPVTHRCWVRQDAPALVPPPRGAGALIPPPRAPR
jgi:hypothetical protein